MKDTSFRGSPPAPAQTPEQSSQTVNPWAPIQPAIQQGYQMAANAFANGPEKYTPWSQAAALTPDQLAQIQGTNAYVNSPGTQKAMAAESSAVRGMMTDANNPYAPITAKTNPALAGYLSNNNIADTSQGLNHFMYQNLNDPTLQNSMHSADAQVQAALGGVNGAVQHGFGFGQNLAQNTDQFNRTAAQNTALSNAFNSQNANRLSAINAANGVQNNRASLAAGLQQAQGQYGNNAMNMGYSNYTNALQNPLQMLTQLNNVGAIQQGQTQAQLDNATAAWNQAQNAPYQALSNYATLINPNKQWGNTYTSNNTSSQQAGTNVPALAVGGATSLAGLAGTTKSGLL